MCNVEVKREVRLLFMRVAHPLLKTQLSGHTQPSVFPLADVLSMDSTHMQHDDSGCNGFNQEHTRVRFIDDTQVDNVSNESIEYRL
jgi:hypothetical protein